MKKVTAIITARGGSKGLPFKNIRIICGKPLIAYSIEAALECGYIDKCYVTTDDDDIKEASKRFGAQVINRPKELATDTSLSSDAVAHSLGFLKEQKHFPEYFVLLQPTSPLRTGRHLDEFFHGFFNSGMQCGVSITESEHHPWKMLISKDHCLQPLQGLNALESPRQILPKAYRLNGAIYCLSSKLFLKKKSFYVEPAYTFLMPQRESIDIDSEFDVHVMEMLLGQKTISGER